jgi:hypothetical protein
MDAGSRPMGEDLSDGLCVVVKNSFMSRISEIFTGERDVSGAQIKKSLRGSFLQPCRHMITSTNSGHGDGGSFERLIGQSCRYLAFPSQLYLELNNHHHSNILLGHVLKILHMDVLKG